MPFPELLLTVSDLLLSITQHPTVQTVFYFILGLGVLVTIHELGHFSVAKWSGIRVDEFSIGFGPKLIGFRWGETLYKISILPFGGYVKMHGEDPDSEMADEGKEPAPLDPRSFAVQPLYKRVAVVLAGPVMNLLLAFVLMPLAFWIGRMEPAFLSKPAVIIGVKKDSPASKSNLQIGDQILSVDGSPVKTWEDALPPILLHPNREIAFKIRKKDSQLEEEKKILLSSAREGKVGFLGVEPVLFTGNDPLIEKVSPDSPADQAGLKPQDKIIAINQEPVETWEEMTEKVRGSNGKPLQIGILRGGEKKELEITPKFDKANRVWILGVTQSVSKKDFQLHRYPLDEAFQKGTSENVKLFGLTLSILKKLVTFQLSYKALGGPLQIAEATGQAAKSGWGDFFYFLAFLSLQLGIMNLLPIPVLDGGHLLFMAYESLRRKPLSAKKRLVAQQIGMVLLLSLMVLVTVNDVNSLWGKGIRNLWQKFTGLFS